MTTVATPTSRTELLTCMEVWGGSDAASASVSMPGLDAWVHCSPFEQADAGGDVYYVSSCATGRIVRLLLADVSGHGNAVRDTATTLRDLMRRYVNHLDQAAFVGSMNREFVQLSSAGRFATAIVTTFFAPTNVLTLCNAGHPSPLLYRSATRQWSMVRATGSASDAAESDESPGVFNLPLGIDDLGDYRQFAIDLAVGDLVVCYSDSLIESRRDASPDAEFLGEAGLLDAVRNCATLDPSRPADVIPALLEHIGSLNPTNLVNDDATILLFRPNGNAPRPSVLNTALAPLRVIGGAVSSIARGDWRLPLPDFRLANIAGALIPAFNRLWHAPAQRLSAKKPTR